jgi:hypothetical protein
MRLWKPGSRFRSGSMTPPCTRSTNPLLAIALTSRRTVSSETFMLRVSSPTVAEPCVRSTSRMAF